MTKLSTGNLSGAFRDRENPSALNGDDKEQKHYYGIETGNRYVKRFRLMMRNGQSVSIPYAYLPVIILTPEKHLCISTHEMEIMIKGRSLDKIEEWLNEEKILWIKESNTGVDTEDADVFVSEIKIKSEWMH